MTKATTKKELVLRKEPKASTKILDVIAAGESVSILDKVEPWAKVDYNDQEGWLPLSELEVGVYSKPIAPKLETKDIENKAEEIISDIREEHDLDKLEPKSEPDASNDVSVIDDEGKISDNNGFFGSKKSKKK